MHQKKIIIFIALFFVAASAYLFYVSDQGLNSSAGKSWWAVYFEEPQGANLGFVIENHSPQTNFHWEIKADNQKIEAGEVVIKTGESKNIRPEIKDLRGRLLITVSSGNAKKEIYKQR